MLKEILKLFKILLKLNHSSNWTQLLLKLIMLTIFPYQMVTTKIIIIQILQVVMEIVYLMDKFHHQFLKNLLIGRIRYLHIFKKFLFFKEFYGGR